MEEHIPDLVATLIPSRPISVISSTAVVGDVNPVPDVRYIPDIRRYTVEPPYLILTQMLWRIMFGDDLLLIAY